MIRILISGPPASGKSTLARELANEHHAQVVDFDEIARELGSDSHHDHPFAVRRAVQSEIERRLNTLHGSAVIIRSAPRRQDREALADRIGADEVIVLAVGADEAKRRATVDGRPDWTSAAIDRWWDAYEPRDGETEVAVKSDMNAWMRARSA